MIDKMTFFKPFDHLAMAEIKPLLECQQFRSCDYTVGGLYMWRDYFDQKYAVIDNMLVFSAEFLDNGVCYSFPVGFGDLKNAIKYIKEDSKRNRQKMKFCCVTEEGVERLSELIGRPSELIEYRDWADYLYPYENFLGYHGKKLVTQRNHCNRFLRDYPEYEFLPLNAANAYLGKDFLLMNKDVFLKNDPIAKEDYYRSVEVLDHIEGFGFTGGLLSVDGRIIGITVGETIADTLYVHIEKALKDYSGAYPFLASLYAKQNAREGLNYINREEDQGKDGLRKSKLEYRPCAVINKYVVTFD